MLTRLGLISRRAEIRDFDDVVFLAQLANPRVPTCPTHYIHLQHPPRRIS